MAKVNIKSDKITPFWGIYYASKAFYALSLDKVINGTLGVRSSTYNGYLWDEIMSAMSDVFICGGDCVEDINRSECHLRESPEIQIPTSHTIGRTIKEISHEDMEYKAFLGNVFRFNTSPRLNDLLHEFLLVFCKSCVVRVHQLVSYVKSQEVCLPLYRCMRTIKI